MERGYSDKKRGWLVLSQLTMLYKVPMAHCCSNSAMHYCRYKCTTLLLHTISGVTAAAAAAVAAAAQKMS
jgi:hypothetical protein